MAEVAEEMRLLQEQLDSAEAKECSNHSSRRRLQHVNVNLLRFRVEAWSMRTSRLALQMSGSFEFSRSGRLCASSQLERLMTSITNRVTASSDKIIISTVVQAQADQATHQHELQVCDFLELSFAHADCEHGLQVARSLFCNSASVACKALCRQVCSCWCRPQRCPMLQPHQILQC